MIRKSEKLARELIALRLKYSDRDFGEAAEILSSGEFFGETVRAAKLAKPRAVRSKVLTKADQGELSLGAQLMTEKIFRKIGSDKALEMFVRKILDRDILKTGSAVKAFARSLDMELPSKLPSRISIADRFSSHLLRMSPVERFEAIDQASRMEQDVSSLQQWSDVIVRSSDR